MQWPDIMFCEPALGPHWGCIGAGAAPGCTRAALWLYWGCTGVDWGCTAAANLAALAASGLHWGYTGAALGQKGSADAPESL